MYQSIIKRVLDLVIAVMGLPFLLAVFLIISPIIWLGDRGTIFYVANREGKNGKLFKMIKFRTMKMNAPDIRNKDGSTYNNDDDSRLTKIGKILRKTSIDELPQIINVITGDMSIVGPRPLLPAKFNSDLKQLVEMRNKVKPGITGYSQAYYRNSISQKMKFQYDVYYAENISFIFDVKIICRTIKTIIKKENIYNSGNTKGMACTQKK